MAGPRILAGSAKGRALRTPPRGTRPSPARLRAALFDALAFEPRGLFLDLYAGSGAVGLEAASRGWQAVLVERSAAAARLIRENAAACGLRVRVQHGDALTVAGTLAGSIDVLFADPPYEADLTALFQALWDLQAVRPGGRYVFQHPSLLTPALRSRDTGEPLDVDTRRYGSNAISVVRSTPLR
jgi:16S rRNA (guanine966-N2)-methyltransferase